MRKEGFCFGFRLSRGDDRHRYPEHVLEVLVRGLREDGVLLDADGDVAHVINRSLSDATEVAGARKSHVDELIDEIEHAGAAERHLVTDDVALAHLELRNGSFCRARRRLLAGDTRETILDQGLLLLVRLSDAGRDDDLLDTRSRHAVLVAEGIAHCLEGGLLSLFGHHKSLFEDGVALLGNAYEAILLHLAADAGLLLGVRIEKHHV